MNSIHAAKDRIIIATVSIIVGPPGRMQPHRAVTGFLVLPSLCASMTYGFLCSRTVKLVKAHMSALALASPSHTFRAHRTSLALWRGNQDWRLPKRAIEWTHTNWGCSWTLHINACEPWGGTTNTMQIWAVRTRPDQKEVAHPQAML